MSLFTKLFKRGEAKEKSVNPYIDSQLNKSSMYHAGVDVNYGSAMRQADVYACVRIISESVGMIPMKVYRNKDGSLIEVSQGTREYKLYCQTPNDFMSSQELNEYLTTVMLLRGHSFLEIQRNALGGVRGLLPLRYFDSTSVVMGTDGLPVARWVTRSGEQKVSQAPFCDDDLFDVKIQSLNGFSGISPIQMMAEQIGTGIATQRHTAKIFENGTRLSGILSTQDTLDDDAIERLQASWTGAYGGTDNAGKVAVLENDLKYTNITMTNQDAQLLELLQFSRSQIASAYRVPVHMLNDTSAQTMNNVEQNNLQFLKNTLMPIIIKLENAYNKLLPENMVLRFDTRQFVRGDIKTQAAVAETLIKNRIISHEESREMFDMAPSNPSDLFVIQSNNYTWGTMADADRFRSIALNQQQQPMNKPTTEVGNEKEPENGAEDSEKESSL